MNKYDVIVVGAGNGGLTAAATAAKGGLKVLLLEKHNLPGGCATSFSRGRFEFEPSLHELCSVGNEENQGSIYKILSGLGADIDWRYEYNPFHVIKKGEDGFDVTLRGGSVEAFIDSMEEAVPGCREAMIEFCKLGQTIDEAMAIKAKGDGEKKFSAKIAQYAKLVKYLDFARAASCSVEDVLHALNMPQKAIDILSTYWGYLGVPTDELNCLHYLSMFLGYVKFGSAMPYRRSHELALSLCKVIYDHGGEIWYNSEVTKFLYDETGKAIGVCVGEKELFADEIISNVIAHNVFNMSDYSKIPDYDLKLANARDFGISITTIYLGLDCTADELGIDDYTTFIVSDGNARKQYDNRKDGSLYIVNCLNKVIPDCTPEGTSTLFFSIPIFGNDIPTDLTPEGYKKFKNEIAKKYIGEYEKVIGKDIFSHIEEISVATPVTFARYLGTPDGTIYGYRSSDWDNVVLRTITEAKDSSIPGLRFCGGHGIQGDGFSSAIITGDMAGKRVVDKLKGGNK